ncbi:MAG: M48 family metalloprotease [Rhizobiales bacterium]|nr:M48 family metalloprotease [Hyphomicrobiales bacterium]
MTTTFRHQFFNILQTALLLGAIGTIGWLVLSSLFSGIVAAFAVVGIGIAAVVGPGWSAASMLRSYGARQLGEREFPEANAMLAHLANQAALPAAPKLYYLPSAAPNAFATGSIDDSVVCVSDGLLRLLNRREFFGVLAHEVTHIANRDLWIMGLADVMSRAVSLASYVGQFILLLNLPLLLIGALTVPWIVPLMLIFAPTVISLLQLALSRSREFDADLGAAKLTGDPLGLASALAKLERRSGRFWEDIFLPSRRMPDPSLLRTHPPTEDRISRLKELAARLQTTISGDQDRRVQIPPRLAPVTRKPRLRWTGAWY